MKRMAGRKSSEVMKVKAISRKVVGIIWCRIPLGEHMHRTPDKGLLVPPHKGDGDPQSQAEHSGAERTWSAKP